MMFGFNVCCAVARAAAIITAADDANGASQIILNILMIWPVQIAGTSTR